MSDDGARLEDLCARLRGAKGMLHKGDIATAYRALAHPSGAARPACRVGDDCAAIPDRDGFLLFAIEGLLDEFVRLEPWFAGYCGVMVNLSDVAAMGGRPTAIVDALWTDGRERAEQIWNGMRAAADAYGVPIVGGHTNARSDGDRLAVSVLGRANRLMTSFDAVPGDVVLSVVDLDGAYYGPYPYWNCSTSATPGRLRADLERLAAIADDGLCAAAKDVSMGGFLGTLLMLLEGSGVGAEIDLERVPKPPDVGIERWLSTFPSYGYLLSVHESMVSAVAARFSGTSVACAPVGRIVEGSALTVARSGERDVFWDWRSSPFTGIALADEPAFTRV